MEYQLAPRAEDDLDEIWLYVARESRSIEIATRSIEAIDSTILSLARNPYLGRRRERDFGPNIRSFPVGDYIILYLATPDHITIYRVVHGRRDLEAIVVQ